MADESGPIGVLPGSCPARSPGRSVEVRREQAIVTRNWPGKVKAYLGVARFDHWHKNLLVLAGGYAWLFTPGPHPGTATEAAGRLALALLSAGLASSANYVVNEILDGPRDRIHPVKRFRAVASGTVSMSVLWPMAALLALTSVALARLFLPWQALAGVLAFLAIGGVVYNVPPLRAKEIPFVDVIVEAVNGPIRVALGWFAVTTASSPPVALLLSCWTFGALVMSGKRYAELRFIGSRMRAAAYRSSFRHYSERSLMIALLAYGAASVAFFALFALATGQLRMLMMVPFMVIFVAWFARLAHADDKAAREPERLWSKPAFAIYSAGLAILFVVLAITGA